MFSMQVTFSVLEISINKGDAAAEGSLEGGTVPAAGGQEGGSLGSPGNLGCAMGPGTLGDEGEGNEVRYQPPFREVGLLPLHFLT